MLGITWRDRKRVSWIMEQTKVEDILTTIEIKKWTWAGHVMRRRVVVVVCYGAGLPRLIYSPFLSKDCSKYKYAFFSVFFF